MEKIEYKITFELTNVKDFLETYPNFKYNYGSFEEWTDANIKYMASLIQDIEGYKLKIKKTKDQQTEQVINL